MKITNFALVIELERHIEILLLKSDCVIVPGLGGFIASHIAARFDDNDNMFIPPVRTLGFNPKLRINDSLLVQSYSEAYDLSYPEAYNRIENEVDELKQHIANNGSYELCNIGTLYLNDDGNIEFTPCEAGILTPELYSLSSFEMKRISEQDSIANEKKEKKATVIPFSTHQPLIKQTPINEQDCSVDSKKGIEKDSGKIQIRISAVRNFAAAVIAVILFMVLGTPVNENSNALRTSNIDNGIINKLISDGYNNITKNKKSITLKATDTTKPEVSTDTGRNLNTGTNQAKAQQATTSKASNYYCIVLASQVTKKNAEAFVKRLDKQGYGKANVLIEKNKSVKVVYGHYASQGEAYNELNNLRGNESFYDAWVYQVKI